MLGIETKRKLITIPKPFFFFFFFPVFIINKSESGTGIKRLEELKRKKEKEKVYFPGDNYEGYL